MMMTQKVNSKNREADVGQQEIPPEELMKETWNSWSPQHLMGEPEGPEMWGPEEGEVDW